MTLTIGSIFRRPGETLSQGTLEFPEYQNLEPVRLVSRPTRSRGPTCKISPEGLEGLPLLARIGLVFLSFFTTVEAQTLLTPENAQVVSQALDGGVKGDRLDCRIEPMPPFLDFTFRFESGYTVQCPVALFGGKENTIISFVRVTPQGGNAVLFGEKYGIPAIPPELASRVNLRKVRSNFEVSGVFLAGEGRYTVEVVIGDAQGRFVKKQWHANVRKNHNEQAVKVRLEPFSIEPMVLKAWDDRGKIKSSGPRLTVLLDAAPINAGSSKLRAWDRALLLGSLSSVLGQLPFSSVRLIAFNLDQQREFFRKDHFDQKNWRELTSHLQQAELGTVSYQVLAKQEGWSDLLVKLVREELASPEASDAVIFLGPTNRIRDKISPALLPARTKSKPEFFYIEYYPYWLQGSEFPDTLAHVTRELDGNILKIHSPGELAQAIQKIQKQLSAKWDGEGGRD